MKISKIFTMLFLLMTTSAYAKIVLHQNTFYVESKGNRTPISLLNGLAQNRSISQVKLFGEGNVNLVAFAKKNEAEKIYSVAEDGYLYSIKPFTDYKIKDVTPMGIVQFEEEPHRSYKVDPKGFFIY